MHIDPRGLRLADGIFELEDGQQLKQASFADIGPFASGVILATYQENLPYLQGGARAVAWESLSLIHPRTFRRAFPLRKFLSQSFVQPTPSH